MNNLEIKELLESLQSTNAEFEVILTGKANTKVNGLYKPLQHEIILFNKNFSNDQQLLYTAIHEYTHHLCWEIEEEHGEKHPKNAHHHKFWNLFHSLLDIAVSKNQYQRIRSEKMNTLIQQAKELDKEIMTLQKKLGEVLIQIQVQAKEDSSRYEDIVEHDIQLSKRTAKKAVEYSAIDAGISFGQDAGEELRKAKNFDHFNTILEEVKNGKTIHQIKHSFSKEKEKNTEEELEKERGRIEKTITMLNQRLREIVTKIEELQEAS